jgi:hypothetical protein
MPKTHHGRMEHKLNLNEKHNLGRMASPSNPSTKSKPFHKKSIKKYFFIQKNLSIVFFV